MQHSFKRYLYFLGCLLSLIGVSFVLIKIYDYSASLQQFHLSFQICTVLFGVFGGYMLMQICFVFAWWHILCSMHTIPFQWALRIQALSQLAKYVPGNVFHFAGRQMLGMAKGIEARSLVLSSIWETGLLVLAACTYVLLIIPLYFPFPHRILLLSIFLFVLICIYAFILKYLGKEKASSFALYFLYCGLSGLLFCALLAAIDSKSMFQIALLPEICGIYVVAWLTGMLTQGSPAGLGVREFILTMLLQGRFAEVDILLAVLLWRIVCVVGDIVFFEKTFRE